MLNDIFFLEIDPQDLVDKMWNRNDGDASHYYTNAEASAEWALFIGQLFEVEYYILDGKANSDYEYDSPEFFAYVTIDGETFDVSGFHFDHDGIIHDNEFYSDRFGDVTHRKATKQELISMAGGENTDYLMNFLVSGEN